LDLNWENQGLAMEEKRMRRGWPLKNERSLDFEGLRNKNILFSFALPLNTQSKIITHCFFHFSGLVSS